ncbi:MAG: hypothetical protein IKU51_04845 [Clostridia bacterium]|nr:hypothetical protein [Clostridia bacterium]
MRLFLKKIFLAPLYLGVAFAGMFAVALVVMPFNFAYLLKVSEETMYVVYLLLSLLFVAIVSTIVRTGYCRKEHVLEPDKRPLFVRVITFREYIMELIVFALLIAIFGLCIGIQSTTSFWPLLLGTLALTLSGTFAFAIADCLIWMIGAKRAYR